MYYGSGECEAQRADGEACFTPGECAGGACEEGVCVMLSFCTGAGS